MPPCSQQLPTEQDIEEDIYISSTPPPGDLEDFVIAKDQSNSSPHLNSDSVLMRSEDEALDFSRGAREDIHEIPNINKRLHSMIGGPLDLTYPSVPPYSQLRFGGVELHRPLPNPQAVQKSAKFTRQVSSAILTGSPEMKKKEEQVMKRNLKKEKQDLKKKMKEEKQDLKKKIQEEKRELKKRSRRSD
ncbi:uncharacterized protein LOC132261144 isoform X2 [Phlebotomus argentipes]|uniref:uncharacterized protein LOC132261144 isoform X2 n=1 Tax=Phlebotomus argentipes TaxID=94469 RepID=UPI00289328E9|nr:uncharacterized protein LOC132261144 isoform X2 [Phlebotomus argentipes]